jgi:hypothetical protein
MVYAVIEVPGSRFRGSKVGRREIEESRTVAGW